MAAQHGRFTVIILNGQDLSQFCDSSEFGRTSDKHDTTGYGLNSHRYSGGLLDGTFTMGGTYDNSATGPHDIITPLLGTTVTLVRRPEGTGTGKPQETVTVLVEKLNESSPVADNVKWSCDLQLAGDVAEINQP